ncbi:MAG: formylglycine-generating enzyme family protein [Candidatus Omnitrophica bacterium]|nr:formylglycine-generating enzyme family protein [Candidatus Omnitrophota bacterium]
MRSISRSAWRLLFLIPPVLSAPGSFGEAGHVIPDTQILSVVKQEGLFAWTMNWGEPNCQSNLLSLLASLREGEQEPLDLDMVAIPSGSFQMGNTGSPRDESFGDTSEYPRHTVVLDYEFELGQYEITNGQYAEMLNWALARGYLKGSNNLPYSGDRDPYYNLKPLVSVGPVTIGIAPDINFEEGRFVPIERGGASMVDRPVTRVTWYGAIAFCNWASERMGFLPAYDLQTWTLVNRQAGGYRLPSESEWEYACRGSTLNSNRYSLFSFGDDPDANLDLCGFSGILDDFMVYCGNDDDWNSAVGTRSPNDYGLHDMHGNAYEWCQDHKQADYDEPGRPDDGSPWMTADTIQRVVRGGSWQNGGAACRSASRGFASAGAREIYIGFRIARTPPISR